MAKAIEITADERAACLNRIELAIHRLRAVTPAVHVIQLAQAIKSGDELFNILLQQATNEDDERLVGKLVLRALNMWRYREAETQASAI